MTVDKSEDIPSSFHFIFICLTSTSVAASVDASRSVVPSRRKETLRRGMCDPGRQAWPLICSCNKR